MKKTIFAIVALAALAVVAQVNITPNPASPGDLGASTNRFPNLYASNAALGSLSVTGAVTAGSFVGDGAALTVDDTAYGVSWDTNSAAPTKNAVYDIIQTLPTNENVTNTVLGLFMEQFELTQSYRTNRLWLDGTTARAYGVGGPTNNTLATTFNYLLPTFDGSANQASNRVWFYFPVANNIDTNHPVTLSAVWVKEVAANAIVWSARFASDGSSTQFRPSPTAWTSYISATNTIANAASRAQWCQIDVSDGILEVVADSRGGMSVLEISRQGDDAADTLEGVSTLVGVWLEYRETD